MVYHMILYIQKGGGKQMSKKKKESHLKLVIELLIAIGAFLTGLASIIQALK